MIESSEMDDSIEVGWFGLNSLILSLGLLLIRSLKLRNAVLASFISCVELDLKIQDLML